MEKSDRFYSRRHGPQTSLGRSYLDIEEFEDVPGKYYYITSRAYEEASNATQAVFFYCLAGLDQHSKATVWLKEEIQAGNQTITDFFKEEARSNNVQALYWWIEHGETWIDDHILTLLREKAKDGDARILKWWLDRTDTLDAAWIGEELRRGNRNVLGSMCQAALDGDERSKELLRKELAGDRKRCLAYVKEEHKAKNPKPLHWLIRMEADAIDEKLEELLQANAREGDVPAVKWWLGGPPESAEWLKGELGSGNTQVIRALLIAGTEGDDRANEWLQERVRSDGINAVRITEQELQSDAPETLHWLTGPGEEWIDEEILELLREQAARGDQKLLDWWLSPDNQHSMEWLKDNVARGRDGVVNMLSRAALEGSTNADECLREGLARDPLVAINAFKDLARVHNLHPLYWLIEKDEPRLDEEVFIILKDKAIKGDVRILKWWTRESDRQDLDWLKDEARQGNRNVLAFLEEESRSGNERTRHCLLDYVNEAVKGDNLEPMFWLAEVGADWLDEQVLALLKSEALKGDPRAMSWFIRRADAYEWIVEAIKTGNTEIMTALYRAALEGDAKADECLNGLMESDRSIVLKFVIEASTRDDLDPLYWLIRKDKEGIDQTILKILTDKAVRGDTTLLAWWIDGDHDHDRGWLTDQLKANNRRVAAYVENRAKSGDEKTLDLLLGCYRREAAAGNLQALYWWIGQGEEWLDQEIADLLKEKARAGDMRVLEWWLKEDNSFDAKWLKQEVKAGNQQVIDGLQQAKSTYPKAKKLLR